VGWDVAHVDRRDTSDFARGVQSYMGGSCSGRLEAYRAYQSGPFVWRSALWEETVASMRERGKALSFVGVILDIAEHFLFAKRYYETLAPEGTVNLTIRLTDTQDSVLKSFGDLLEVVLFSEYVFL